MWAIIVALIILYVASFTLFIRYLIDRSKKRFKTAKLNLILLVISFVVIIVLSYLAGLLNLSMPTTPAAAMVIYWFFVFMFVFLTILSD